MVNQTESKLEKLDEAVLAVMEELEYKDNCSGLCEIPMFFFFKESN
jgi:hypothetical protein